MFLFLLSMALLSADASVCRLTNQEVIRSTSAVFYASDFLEAECLNGVNDFPVARLPIGQASKSLSIQQVHRLVSRALPDLVIETPSDTNKAITLKRLVRDASDQAGCFVLSQSIVAGDPIGSDAILKSECRGDQKVTGISFDERSGLLRADANLPAGHYLGGVHPIQEPHIDAGDTLLVSVNVGVVQIQQKVVALQPAQPGGSVFVKSDGGAIFSVPVLNRPDEGRASQ